MVVFFFMIMIKVVLVLRFFLRILLNIGYLFGGYGVVCTVFWNEWRVLDVWVVMELFVVWDSSFSCSWIFCERLKLFFGFIIEGWILGVMIGWVFWFFLIVVDETKGESLMWVAFLVFVFLRWEVKGFKYF